MFNSLPRKVVGDKIKGLSPLGDYHSLSQDVGEHLVLLLRKKNCSTFSSGYSLAQVSRLFIMC